MSEPLMVDAAEPSMIPVTYLRGPEDEGGV
jgi:hypothetical protein